MRHMSMPLWMGESGSGEGVAVPIPGDGGTPGEGGGGGGGTPPDDGTSAPAITRLGDSGSQGKVGLVSVLARDGKVVTPVQDGDGNLKLITWSISSDGKTVTRLGESGGQADRVDLLSGAFLKTGKLVTAVQDGDGNLKLITWSISSDGKTVTRLGDSGNQAGKIGLVSVASLGTDIVVTSVQDGNGNLKLVTWSISSDGKTVTRRSDSGDQAGKIDLVSIAFLGGSRVVTPVQTGGGGLKLITWDISSDGKTVTRRSDSGDQAGKIGLLSVAVVGVGDVGKVVTPVQTGGGDLKLIAWSSSSRVGDSGNQAGKIQLVSVARLRDGNVVTAVRDGGGNLKLITWH